MGGTPRNTATTVHRGVQAEDDACCATYAQYYGKPPRHLKRQLLEASNTHPLHQHTYKGYYAVLEEPVPTRAQLHASLRGAIRNSHLEGGIIATSHWVLSPEQREGRGKSSCGVGGA